MKPQTRISALTLGTALAAALGATAALSAQEQVRSFQQPFPAAGEVRLANLAGHVEIVKGQGPSVVVEATVHAEAGGAAETQRLLQGMRWVKSHDKKGREEWALSYPVEKYRSYSYPKPNEKDHEENSGLPSFLSFLNVGGQTTTTYLGERVKIYNRKGSAPTLYADLRIALPAGSNVAVRNAVGKVRGETSRARCRSRPAAATYSSPRSPASWGSTPARATSWSARPAARPRSAPAPGTWWCGASWATARSTPVRAT